MSDFGFLISQCGLYLSCARAVCCSPTLWLSPRQRTECTVIRRLEFGLGVNPRFWSCNRRFAPVAAFLHNLARFFSKLTVSIWRHSVKEVFMSLWILGSCFNVRLFILGWSLLRFSHILLPK